MYEIFGGATLFAWNTPQSLSKFSVVAVLVQPGGIDTHWSATPSGATMRKSNVERYSILTLSPFKMAIYISLHDAHGG